MLDCVRVARPELADLHAAMEVNAANLSARFLDHPASSELKLPILRLGQSSGCTLHLKPSHGSRRSSILWLCGSN